MCLLDDVWVDDDSAVNVFGFDEVVVIELFFVVLDEFRFDVVVVHFFGDVVAHFRGDGSGGFCFALHELQVHVVHVHIVTLCVRFVQLLVFAVSGEAEFSELNV